MSVGTQHNRIWLQWKVVSFSIKDQNFIEVIMGRIYAKYATSHSWGRTMQVD